MVDCRVPDDRLPPVLAFKLERNKSKQHGGRQIASDTGSARGCTLQQEGHLCEPVEAEIRSTAIIGTGLTVVDIDEDSVLHDKYWLRIPVVRVEGEDVFEAKMMDQEGEWKNRLAHILGW